MEILKILAISIIASLVGNILYYLLRARFKKEFYHIKFGKKKFSIKSFFYDIFKKKDFLYTFELVGIIIYTAFTPFAAIDFFKTLGINSLVDLPLYSGIDYSFFQFCTDYYSAFNIFLFLFLPFLVFMPLVYPQIRHRLLKITIICFIICSLVILSVSMAYFLKYNKLHKELLSNIPIKVEKIFDFEGKLNGELTGSLRVFLSLEKDEAYWSPLNTNNNKYLKISEDIYHTGSKSLELLVYDNSENEFGIFIEEDIWFKRGITGLSAWVYVPFIPISEEIFSDKLQKIESMELTIGIIIYYDDNPYEIKSSSKVRSITTGDVVGITAIIKNLYTGDLIEREFKNKEEVYLVTQEININKFFCYVTIDKLISDDKKLLKTLKIKSPIIEIPEGEWTPIFFSFVNEVSAFDNNINKDEIYKNLSIHIDCTKHYNGSIFFDDIYYIKTY